MNQDDDAGFAPDDGTPLHALAELRRAMGDRYDKASGEVLHAVDRAHSAVIQADSAKTAQEEMRHLIRALATASEVFILTPRKIQETYREVLERLRATDLDQLRPIDALTLLADLKKQIS